MEEVKEIKNKFVLPSETITVRYIPRKRGMAANVDKDHVIAGGMLNTAVRKFSTPLQRNGSIKNVLTDEEKAALEKMTGLNLSVYGDFWTSFAVPLKKEDAGNIFHLNEPMDYISYKILMSLKEEIAPSWADRNKSLTYQFAITKDGEQMLEEKSRFDAKKEAFKMYGKIEDNKEMVMGVLRLLTNKPISRESKLDWLQTRIENIIDTEPQKFLSAMKDAKLHTRILINAAVDAGVIKKSGNKYSTVDGLELCNEGETPSFDNAVRYLDAPINQEVRSIIEVKVEDSK